MKHLLFGTLTCVLLFFPRIAISGITLKVNTSIKPPFSTQDGTGFFDDLLKELGHRLNINFELVRLPPERALVSANHGLSDGELPRIAGLHHEYPNLIQVEEKVIDYQFVAFGRNGTPVTSWHELKGKRVGYLIGWKIFENNVPKEAIVTKLQKPFLLFDMLDQGRLDVALYEKYAGWEQIHTDNHQTITQYDKPLAVMPMYLYLHNSHVGLAPLIGNALKDMKKDGAYDRILKRLLAH